MAITPASLEETKRNLQTEKREIEEKKREKEKEKKAEESAEITLEEEELYRKGVTTVRDLIAPSSLRVTPYYLQLGNQYLRTIFVVGFPRYIYVGWFSPVMHLNIAMDIAMFFYPVPSKAVLKQLQKRVGNIEAEIIAGQEKGAPRDPLKETALRDIEKLRDDLTTGVEHFFQFGLYVTIYASSEKELERFTEQVESIFGSKLVYTRHSFYQSEQGFNSTLPLGIDELMVLNNLNTSPCASSFPFISADLTSDNGILYGINRHNNSLILFDRFSMPNANMTVFATSGAGKSISKDETVLI
ncbi:MAG: conjugal transfer protein TraC, partial [Thermoplasmata archaeon]